MSAVAGDLADLVQIEDPAFFADDPFLVLARLRNEAPVHWYEPLQTWVVSKYEDARYVGRTPLIFSNAGGILLNDIRYGRIIKRLFPKGAENLSTSDPPRHRDLKRCIAPSFTPNAIRKLEETSRRFSRELIDTIVPGEPFGFVERIASILPLKVLAVLLGLPGDDRTIADLKYWSDERIKVASAHGEDVLLEAAVNGRGDHAYFDEWMVRMRGSESDEMIPTLLRATLGGEPVGYENLHAFLSTTMVAGNETTRDYLAGSLFAFAEHPEQRAAFVADPTLVNRVVEECLRWVTPVRGFIRTVTEDTTLRGQKMKEGQHVYLFWMAANRDEEVWENAGRFDITRKPDPMHLAFGFGEHGCLGAPLARLEGRVFFEELVQRYPHWEVAGEPTRPHSTLHNSFEELPLVFHP